MWDKSTKKQKTDSAEREFCEAQTKCWCWSAAVPKRPPCIWCVPAGPELTWVWHLWRVSRGCPPQKWTTSIQSDVNPALCSPTRSLCHSQGSPTRGQRWHPFSRINLETIFSRAVKAYCHRKYRERALFLVDSALSPSMHSPTYPDTPPLRETSLPSLPPPGSVPRDRQEDWPGYLMSHLFPHTDGEAMYCLFPAGPQRVVQGHSLEAAGGCGLLESGRLEIMQALFLISFFFSFVLPRGI